MSALLYHMAYILTAGYDYKASSSSSSSSGADSSGGRHDERMDSRRLITNLSVNKAIAGHPGQVPCNVLQEYPAVYANISVLWKEVAVACSSFMGEQTSAHHFEFFGIDVIADEDGTYSVILLFLLSFLVCDVSVSLLTVYGSLLAFL
jgi:hypothetical protein